LYHLYSYELRIKALSFIFSTTNEDFFGSLKLRYFQKKLISESPGAGN
jgi:hypothetical protein